MAETAPRVAEDRDRIAQSLNEVVVRRLFGAGLDLEAALALMGDHRAARKVGHAIDELDQAICDIRTAIFGSAPGQRLADEPPSGTSPRSSLQTDGPPSGC